MIAALNTDLQPLASLAACSLAAVTGTGYQADLAVRREALESVLPLNAKQVLTPAVSISRNETGVIQLTHLDPVRLFETQANFLPSGKLISFKLSEQSKACLHCTSSTMKPEIEAMIDATLMSVLDSVEAHRRPEAADKVTSLVPKLAKAVFSELVIKTDNQDSLIMRRDKILISGILPAELGEQYYTLQFNRAGELTSACTVTKAPEKVSNIDLSSAESKELTLNMASFLLNRIALDPKAEILRPTIFG